ncbi:MAG TPA: hypothetical protein VKG87_12960 [Terriglobales bacterium]|nr:hypothetical protein [Terriglobales bacterium]
MPLPPVPNAAKVTIHGIWDSQQTITDLWFIGPDANPSPAQMTTLGNLVATWLTDWFLGPLCTAYAVQKVRVKDMSQVDGPLIEVFTPDASGGVSSEPVPNNVDPAITFRSSVGGRSGHGRVYIPGTPNSEVTLNTVSNTFIGLMTDAFAQFLPAGATDPTPFVWSVVSYFTAGAPRVTPFSFPIINVGFTDNIVDSQRRRLPGRGK